MTQNELNILLDQHKLWFDGDYKQGRKLALVNEYLRGLDLSYRDLRNANLCRAYLRNADLSNANLCRANLSHADLCRADLCRADLSHANLCNANLRDADLRDADLRNANLCNANLCRADLRDADLSNANLDFATLPLWCGGSRFIADDSIVRQILAHVCTIKCENLDWLALREVILPFARKSHRAQDLHLLEDDNDA